MAKASGDKFSVGLRLIWGTSTGAVSTMAGEVTYVSVTKGAMTGWMVELICGAM